MKKTSKQHNHIRRLLWPVLGITAVIWSLHVLYQKLCAEVTKDPFVQQQLDGASIWKHLYLIFNAISDKLNGIPWSSYVFAFLSTLIAYAALAYYDRIALIHLERNKGIPWYYVACCSFVTYALSHNIGASVLSGGMVRLRAYTAKGLRPSEVALLILLCSYTFAFGVCLLTGFVLLIEPSILKPLGSFLPYSENQTIWARSIGAFLLLLCGLYCLGSLMQFKPRDILSMKVVYPKRTIVFLQCLIGPLELIGAAGIIYFALPADVNPGFTLVLGAFLLSFSIGLLSQVPGGMGVMEATFLAVMPDIPSTSLFASLLVWRLFYLLLPLGISLPIILLFERSQFRLLPNENR